MNILLSLERLILSSNRIPAIPSIAESPTSSIGIKHLSLSFNDLRVWTDIDMLSQWCPTLETLGLRGNPLVEGGDQRSTCFTSFINFLRSCRPADWAVRTTTRHRQDTFTKSLRRGHSAFVLLRVYLFYQPCAFTAFHQISSRERTDCELFYLSYITKGGPASNEERRREHPRWDDLCASPFFLFE
jgi:hypothetical protein